jgi:H+/gluconate symporter-like permease
VGRLIPHEVFGQIIGEVAEGVAQEVSESVHRRFGWKGCTFMFVLVGMLVGGTIYLIR